MKKKLISLLNESFYKNSLFLLITNIINIGAGFLFSIAITNIFSEYEVGIYGILISAATFIYTLSLFSFDEIIIKYYHNSDEKNKLFATSINVAILAAIISCTIFIIFLNFFSLELAFIYDNPLYILIFYSLPILGTISPIITHVFIAAKKTKHNVIRSLTYNLSRLALPFLLAGSGAIGIYLSGSISYLIGIISMVRYLPVRYSFKINTKIIKKVFRFGFGTYVSQLLILLPRTVIPFIVTYTLGPTETAFFYIAYRFSELFRFIPKAIGKSYFAESESNRKSNKDGIIKSIGLVLLILIPAVTIVIIAGRPILSLYGKSYATNSFPILALLAFSSIFSAASEILIFKFKIEHRMKCIILSVILPTLLKIFLGYILSIHMKLIGIGIAWLLGEITLLISLLLIRPIYKKGRGEIK